MSASVCASCLSRLRLGGPSASRIPRFILPIAAPFSTTTAQQANPVKKKTTLSNAPRHREARGARIKRKTRDRPRPPAPGERRAQKKRIVLSNSNALEVPGLENLTSENMVDASKVGHMLALNGSLLDQLRENKTFKTTQNWGLFRQPSTLIRQETLELAQDIRDIGSSQQDQGFGAVTMQKIVTGEKECGKSIHLLQGQAMAFLNGWVVVSIPECQDFVINTSPYAPVTTDDQSSQKTGTEQQLYDQPRLASQLLSRIASANAKVLQNLKLVHQHPKSLPYRPTKTSNLFNLAEAGANDPQIATPIFHAVWKELTEPVAASTPSNRSSNSSARPPVLVTIDGLDHWMGPTLYHSSDYKVIHAHQLTLIRHFLSLLFPTSQSKNPSFASGGLVLAATTGSNKPNSPSFALLLQQLQALQSGQNATSASFPVPKPYAKVDQAVLDLVKNAQGGSIGVTPLKGLSKPESKGLLEYFAHSGILQERVTDSVVGERWSLSGGGVVGELARMGRRMRI